MDILGGLRVGLVLFYFFNQKYIFLAHVKIVYFVRRSNGEEHLYLEYRKQNKPDANAFATPMGLQQVSALEYQLCGTDKNEDLLK